MNVKHTINGLLAVLATTSVAVTLSPEAHAFTLPSSGDYYNRLNTRLDQGSNDFIGLEYDQWVKFNGFVNQERRLLTEDELTPLDIDNLTWEAGVNDVEVYFINEGAGYHNEFFFSTDGERDRDSMNTIFEDASSRHSILANGGPLALGEGRNLGSFDGATTLSFLLKNPRGNVYGHDVAQNQDGLQHITAFQSDGFLILGFEDLDGGGDRDYNDVVIAVKGLVDTEDSASVPEPATGLAMLGMSLIGWKGLRRRRSDNA